MESPKNDLETPEQGRPENARSLFFIVGILAVFGLVGGYWGLKTSIEQPLAFTENSPINTSTFISSSDDSEEARILTLQNKDTDQDGITDYDELYQYGTSPYLADSDSDGIEDIDEINNGDDPNCPTDTVCSPIAAFTPTFTSDGSITSTIDGPVDVDELRKTLRNSGAPQAELDALTDEELLALYAEVFEEEGQANTNTETDEISDVELAQLRDLTPAEIRKLLLLGGAEQAELDEIDDETLQAIFLESVQNIQTGS